MTTKLECQLTIRSNLVHLQQLYTGLSILRRQKRITLGFGAADPLASVPQSTTLHPSVISLYVNGKVVVFDVADAAGLNPEMLSAADLYFKRSYDAAVVETSGALAKVRPYGLNYWVLPNFVDGFGLRRALALYRGKRLVRQIAPTLDVGNRLHYSPRLRDLQASPMPKQEPKILFLARTWDPDKSHFQITEARQADRREINDMRAACVRALRKRFGGRFTGGLAPTAHARAQYPDCVVGEAGVTEKKHYLNMVKRHSICVSTTGLQGSVGWKFGEYVALSRAIVSEPLGSKVPGKFGQDRNFLEFETVDQCVEQVGILMDSAEKRAKLMQANYDYYQVALRPDQLVLNCLQQVLS